MEPHELVRNAYRKNTTSGFAALHSDDHSLTVELDDWPTKQQRVDLNSDDFPYLKLALIDRYLDDKYEW